MSHRRLLIDNDAFVLLAGASLLDEAITLAGFSPPDARRLRSLEFMLRKGARAFQKYPAEVINRALEDCVRIKPLEEVPSREAQSAFEQAIGVDEGEAVLYGVVAEHQFHFLASNDKTAMRAVAGSPQLAQIRGQVAGRIVCMEWLLGKFLATLGPEVTAQRFTQLIATEKRLGAILSPAATGRPEDCLVAAESFLSGLRRDLGQDFLFIG
jgi:hypothetical protein